MTEPFEITGGFSDPFLSGGTIPPDDLSLPCSIGGRAFNLDLASQQFSRRSVQLLNTQQASGPGDTASLSPEVWRRAVESWHSGAGQRRLDREDSIDTRFFASVGVDPWTKYQLSLLPEVTSLLALSGGETAILRSIGATLFVIRSTTVRVYTDAVNSTSFTSEAIANPPIGATCDGEVLYILDNTGVIHTYNTTTATWNHALATVASFVPTRAMIAYVKGFLLVGNGATLFDYTTPGTPVTIMTHRLSGWWWRAACEGTSVVYILGGIGDRWHVLRASVKTTGAGLDPPIVATTLPEGEFAYTVASYLGYVLIGCHLGWRFAVPDGSGNLTYGQVIKTPHPVKCFEGQDRFVWFGLSISAGDPASATVYDSDVWTETCGLGRADLSTFINTLTPAAASDLQAPADVFGTTTDVVTVGSEANGLGLRVFSVTGASAGGVYIQAATKVASGWLRQGPVTFNSADKKKGLYGQAFHEALDGEIDVQVSVDGKDFVSIGHNSAPGSTTLGNMPFNESFSTVEYKYVLTRDVVTTNGPRLARTEFRAVNIPGRATEWRIPIMVAENNSFSTLTFTRDVESDYDYLVGLVQSREQFTYREGDRSWSLHATDFLWQPSHLTADGGTYQGTFILVAREIN